VLIQPWDAAADATEWREWLSGTDRFGTLVVNNLDPARAPLSLEAKFKYDDQKPLEHRERVSRQLDERGRGLDGGAADQQRRRLRTVGDWQTRDSPG
jgi:transcriptional regulator